MTLNAEQKTEIWHHYDTWMTGYLNADVQTYDAYFDDDYHFIGSTNNEEFLNRKDTTKFFELTGEQFAGITEIRNETKIMEAFGTSVFLTHVFDGWFLHDKEWTYYGRFRFSSVMQKKEAGWRFIYQHFSMPDLKSDEGQTIGYENITAENFELKEAIKRRTIELEVKNKELEIEAALERVRSRSMAMHNSDELNEVVSVLFKKLKGLQIPFTAVGIATGIEGSKELNVFVCGENEAGLVISNYRLPYFDNPISNDLYSALEKQLDFFVGHYSKEEKNSFYEYVIENTAEFRHLPEDIKQMIFESPTYTISTVAVKNAVFSINDFEGKVLAENEIDIIKRFARVFDQAYTRFLDLQKAEAQAREAQIQLSLERIRSKAMAMQHSDELSDFLTVLFEQFDVLNLRPVNCILSLFDIENNRSTFRMTGKKGATLIASQEIDLDASPVWKQKVENWKSGHPNDVDVIYIPYENLPEIAEIFKEILEKLPEDERPLPEDYPNGEYIIDGYCKYGYLGYAASGPPSEEEKEITRRIANEFGNVYQRFLDLQNAENQAREAQIEAALERVRSRTMAMQSSAELGAVAAELFAQMNQLVTNLWTCGFVLCEKDRDEDEWWLSMDGDFTRGFFLPNVGDYAHATLYEGWQRSEALRAVQLDGESLQQHYDWLMEIPVSRAIFEEMDAAGLARPDWQKLHAAYFSKGYLVLITREPCGEEEIFKRFAQVFDQTYTRFLDLQKAEAQAKEAQIEAALERVRSRSLAMHKTVELQSVIHTVHQELLNLSISISGGSFIVINSEIDNEIHCWGSGGTAETSDEVHIPRFEKPFYTHLLERIKSGAGFFTEEYTREEKIEFFTFLFQHEPWSKLSAKEKKNTLSAPGGYTRSCTVSKHTSIFIINHFGEKFSESENAILIRFGKVFEQSYTRFLDLQKAEAQAKEAQIELSLERIRSQVTAMQESSDLLDIVVTMRTEFVKLGHEAHYFWHMRWLPERYDKAMTSGDGTKIGMVMTLPRHIHGDIPLVADWEKTKEPTVVLAMEVETAVDYVHKMITLGDFEQVDPQAPTLDDIRHIGGLTFVMARTTHGEIGYSLPGVVTDPPKNAVDTLIRFAGVFDLAYKRFEDLKSAERQHREAQIELALERVRARTMAMQKSEELADAAFVLFEQLRALGGNLWGTGFGLCQEHVEKDEFWFANENGVFPPVAIPNTTDPAHKQMYQGWQKKTDFLSIEKSGAALKSHYDYMLSLPEVRLFFQKIIDEGLSFPEKQQWNAAYFSKGYLLIITLEPYPEPEIFKRFAKVFEQTYTRFLDLQKAEAQAREAEIQLALERVRARSLAMHRSEELADISMELVKQVQTLGMESWFCAFNIYEEDGSGSLEWGSNGQGTFPQYRTPREGVFLRYFEAGQRGETLLVNEIGEDECPAHYEYLCSLPGVGEQLLQMKAAGIPFPTSQIDHVAFFKYGYVLFITYEPAPESHDVFKRFANVFEQSYTRFLDLKKAEAQAREAQIENALERVRSRTMAMQRSDELTDVASLLFNQVSALGIKTWSVGFNVWSEDNNSYVDYISLHGEIFGPNIVHTEKAEALKDVRKARKSGVEFDVLYVEGKKIKQLHMALGGVDEKEYDSMLKDGLLPAHEYEHFVFGAKVSVMFITNEPVPEAHDIFKRLGKVFEQTYTRFLDLQKAEAQTREAKIEGALEKVRSRTMGMQSSEELPEVANLLFTEVRALGIHAWSCGYNILAENKKTATCCMSSEGTLQTPFQLRLWGENSFDEMGEFVLSDHTMLVQELGGTALEEHYARMKSFPDLKPTFDEIDRLGLSLPTYQINHLCRFTQGFILFITYEKVPESHAIFKRFTNVFDQTYTRFLDLKKAEAQAREAQIENALEKVRSRSLAMQSPDELIEVAQLLREEMGALGVEELETSSIYIHDKDSNTTQCWFTIKNSENPGKSVTDQMTLELQDTWVGRKMLDFYRSPSNQTSILMQGEQRIEWIRYCEEKSDLFGTSNFYGDIVPDRTYHLYKFSNGYIGAAAPGEISTESWELLKRATAVFSFAYTRFRDLQMAEASARAAMRQASLDRVRAEISSMRHVNDLERITPLFFQELTTLGIPFIRCGVFIIQEKQEIVEAYLSSPDGNSLGVLRLPYQASELTFQTVEAWRKGEVYKQHWNKEDFIQWISQLMEQDQIQDSSTYQGAAAPPESLDLHFVPFTQGMLYVGAVSPLDEKELELVQALAKAFSIAYARYEDFVKLEQAKAEVESAMTELKATQSQLVQQEKLASLGQLTAGIAHEIKNPLNFVNNFSEVSIEMIEEIKEERAKSQETRDETLVDEILEDIQSNLGKIHEHGSRANGIVTSMLQHSRGGSGKMEPTDLNALIKEYVNLSFHGMRAGKNPINVDLVFDLDPELGEVSLIKEDFTRVVINLCNNAFDAMRGKKYEVQSTKYQEGEHSDVNYLPKLKVSTILENDRIRISFEDNGPGIPDEIKDKILQPFFTTKKGTEGTGLGLSITHDIVKAHGGELSVKSIADEGTTFIIQLPKK